MRIAMLSLWYIEHSISLANALSKNNDVFLILSENPVTEDFLPLISEKVNYIILPKPEGSFAKKYKGYRDIFNKISTFKPDVLHIQDGNPYIAILLLGPNNYKVITSIHDPLPHKGEKWGKKLLSAFFMNRISDEIIVHANVLKKLTSRLFLKSKTNIHAIPLGIHDIYKYWQKDRRVKKEKHNILFFGRIWKYKGLEYFIKAQTLVNKEVTDTNFIIAGRGENIDKYLNMIENPNGFEIINDYISNEKVAELFESATVVVMPYIEATQSAVLMTAFAFNKPVIVTNVGGLPESVDYGNAGIIIPPQDTNALADAILKILRQTDLVDLLKRNIEQQSNRLSYDNVAKMTLEIYSKKID